MPTLKRPDVKATELGATFPFAGDALSGHAHDTQKVVDEVVAVTSDTGTLANEPALVQNVFATAGDVTGNMVILPAGETPGTGQVAINMSTGVLTFFATDSVDSVKVTYLKKATTSVSAGTPAGDITPA